MTAKRNSRVLPGCSDAAIISQETSIGQCCMIPSQLLHGIFDFLEVQVKLARQQQGFSLHIHDGRKACVPVDQNLSQQTVEEIVLNILTPPVCYKLRSRIV